MRNGSWLAVGLLCVFAARSEAQPVPLTITCSDISGRPAPPVQVMNGTIDGAYSVGNRCTPALNCTFTMEVGTLPDADADVGSWRGFRAQKTITEQHRLGPMAAKAEFRFHVTVDAIPTGDSVDFRVLTSCR